jgi:hypothetical protein
MLGEAGGTARESSGECTRGRPVCCALRPATVKADATTGTTCIIVQLHGCGLSGASACGGGSRAVEGEEHAREDGQATVA